MSESDIESDTGRNKHMYLFIGTPCNKELHYMSQHPAKQ